MKIQIIEYFWWVPDVVEKGKFKTFVEKIAFPDNSKKSDKKILPAKVGEFTMKKGGITFSIDQITKNGVRITAGKGLPEEKSATVTDKRNFIYEIGSGSNGYRYEVSVFEE